MTVSCQVSACLGGRGLGEVAQVDGRVGEVGGFEGAAEQALGPEKA